MRRFLVWPSSLLWPGNLPSFILMRTLHDRLVDGSSIVTLNATWKISRLNFFILATICQCVYFWLTDCIMPILSFFAWLCWFKVTNLRLVELTGMQGFGIGSLRLSWASIIGAWNSPIIVPYWAKINILIGFVLIVWILSPLGFYTNFLELHFSPIRTIAIVRSKGYFDNFHEYIDQPKFLFNETKYKLYVEKYGEHRFSVALLLHFGLTLALITSLMVHTILYHGHDIVKQAHTSLSNRSNDIHCFLMSLYPETPEWWFTIVFLLSLLSGILACQYGQLMEWYHVLLGVAVSWVLILPYGIIRATTGLNVINDTIPLLVGSLISHHEPIKILTLRLYFWYLQTHALTLVSNLKLCHYAKIPPRSVFIVFIVGHLVTAIISYVVSDYLLTNIHEICSVNNVNWSCSKTAADMEKAVIWASTG